LDSRALHNATFCLATFSVWEQAAILECGGAFHHIDHLSTPLAWTEVKESIEPAQFNIKSFGQCTAKEDPWNDFFKSRQSLAPAISKLKKL
jgi:hypothetical protein